MQKIIVIRCSYILLLSLLSLTSYAQDKEKQGPYILDIEDLKSVKERLKGSNSEESDALVTLKKEADSIMKIKAHSVIEKSIVPPSGSKHDYVSMAQYWWPNPNTKNGLPYVRKDGQTNPESYQKVKDRSYLYALCRNIQTLGLVYFYTEEDIYAQKVGDLLETWFLNEATKMNPNLDFGQYIPGKEDGRREGIIDTREFVNMLDAVELVKNSEYWTVEKHEQLRKWFADYLDWLQYSDLGLEAATRLENNIGTAYDMQLIYYALFTGNDDIATRVILQTSLPRMEKQFDVSGSQPNEMARKDGWNYSLVNLRYWMNIARMAEHIDIDVWNYKTSSEKSLKKVYQWMLPYAQGEKEWGHGQSGKTNIYSSFQPLMKRASSRFEKNDEIQTNIMQAREKKRAASSSRLPALEVLKGNN